MELTEQELERFWAKVRKTDYCWLWTAAIQKQTGYGAFGLRGKIWTAHTVSFVISGGQPRKGMRVDHKCHVRNCVNPTHLRHITHKQNIENRSGLNSNNKSGARGVLWDKARKKWRAEVVHDGRNHYAGRFESLEDAIASAIAKRDQLFTHNDRDKV